MAEFFDLKGLNGPIDLYLSPQAADDLGDCRAVIAITIFKGRLLMSFHMKRKGWEFPGGRREENEAPLQSAVREIFEESGGIVGPIIPLGYYVVRRPQGLMKAGIFAAGVLRVEEKPVWSEMGEVRTFEALPEDITFKDDVYRLVLEYMESQCIFLRGESK